MESGFPWYGFYLFRRGRRIGDPICLSAFTRLLQPGLQPGGAWASPIGRVVSDTNLSLTDDFAPPAQGAGDVEFDLEHRRSLSFLVSPGRPVRRVEARIGFRAAAQLTVTALLWGVPVAEMIMAGTPGQVVGATLLFGAIRRGRVGLYCWADAAARFEQVVTDRVRRVGRWRIRDDAGTHSGPSV